MATDFKLIKDCMDNNDIVTRLNIKAGAMEIAWGGDTSLMREAAHTITTLRADEEGAKIAFDDVIMQKRDAEHKCTKLQNLLDAAYDDIQRLSA